MDHGRGSGLDYSTSADWMEWREPLRKDTSSIVTRYRYIRELREKHKGDRAIILDKGPFRLAVASCRRLSTHEETAEPRVRYPSEKRHA